MTMHDRSLGAGVSSGAALVARALARLAAPAPELSVSEWAERYRRLSAKASKHAGRWRNDRTPYLVEIMDAMGVNNPSTLVAVGGAAQAGKTEAVLNALGHMVHLSPRPGIGLFPSQDVARAWEDEKFGEMVEATPELRLRVMRQESRSNRGSTARRKKYQGGAFDLLHAGSSKGLQMVSKGFLLVEELDEIPEEAGERGDPVAQAEKRLVSWGDEAKRVMVSTYGLKGRSRIDRLVRGGTYRRYHMACPHCGWRQSFEYEQLKRIGGRAVLVCLHCEGAIGHEHKRDMVAGGEWISCYLSPDPAAAKFTEEELLEREPPENPANPRPPACFAPEDLPRWRARDDEGRYPSYHFWQVVSPFVAWEAILREADAAEADPEKRPAFVQQTLARPYELASSAPKHAELAELARGAGHARGEVPPGYCLLTMGVDVQGDRLEWGVWAWGPFRRGALVDHGVIAGSPEDRDTWAALHRLVCREWGGPLVIDLALDGVAVDSGYKTEWVYGYSRAVPGVYAIKGTADPEHPALGAPTEQKATLEGRVIRANVFAVGAYRLKKRIYEGLHAWALEVETGKPQPGALSFHREVDEAYFRQLVAERLSHKHRDAKGRPKWVLGAHVRNEALDIAVYAMARAHGEGWATKSHDDWEALFECRGRAGDVPPLLEQMTGAPKPVTPPPAAAPDEPAPRYTPPPRPGGARQMPEWMRRTAQLNKGGARP